MTRLVIAPNWLNFILYGQGAGRAYFLDATCGLCQRPNWTVQSKNWDGFTSTPEIGAVTGIEVLPDGRLQAAAEPTRRGGGSAAVVCPAADHPLPASPQAQCAPVPAG